MAITFGSVSPVATAKALTLTITKPSTLAIGDLMLMAVGNSAPSRTIQPAGWGTVYDGIVTDVGGALFYKFATSTDVAAANFTYTYTTSTGSGFACCGAIACYSGVAAIRLVNLNWVSTAGGTTAAGALPTPAGAVAGEWVVGAYIYGTDGQPTSFTLTYPTTGSWNQRVRGTTAFTPATFQCGLMLVDKAAATDSPTGAVASLVGMWTNGAIILTPTTPANPSPRTNKNPNPAAANNTTGWSVNGAACTGSRITGATGFSRSTSYRMTISSTPGANTINRIIPPSVLASAGQRWAASAEVKSSIGGNGRPVAVFLNFYNSGGTLVAGPSTVIRPSLTTAVQTVTFYGFLAPASTDHINVELSTLSYDIALNDQFEMSGVMYEQIYQAQPYFDGDSSGWVWDGAQGNSTSQPGAGPPPGNFLPFLGHHDPELPGVLVTPKATLWTPGRAPRRRRRVLDCGRAAARRLTPR